MTLKLKPGPRHRVLRGHPWVFASEVQVLLPSEYDGQAVALTDSGGRHLGMGIYNSNSSIIWRRFTREEGVAFDRAYLETAVPRAIARREEEPFRRLVWSEADDLPGLVVDQFEEVLVIQAVTLAVDSVLDDVAEILESELSVGEIVYRNDAPTREYEGVPIEVRTRSGDEFAPRWFHINGIDYLVDLEKGQKTGFFLDQRQQHVLVSAYAEGRRVLDGFCNQGAFALNCAKSGAASVLGIDSSKPAIEASRQNAERNNLDVEFRCENMFDYFTENRDAEFDLIVLDPPSFARNRAALKGALRGYKELNLRALQCLAPGGILATYSCSQHVSRRIFMEILTEAVIDTRRDVTLLAQTSQPLDHPVRLNFPESEYLRGCILRVE